MKKLIFAPLRPLLDWHIRRKYRDYWGLKAHLQQHPSRLLRLAYDRYFLDQGSYVGLGSTVKGKPYFPHGCVGVFISKDAVIGENVVIFQQVTIGSNALEGSAGAGAPVIGDHVYIGAGAKIIGGVTVGHHCRIGANAVVYKDLPPHSVAVCSPTRAIQKENLDNTFYTVMDAVRYAARDGYLVEAPSEESRPTIPV